ncbi:IclR family transcriptional regulator [Alloyangia pacifica]|uniref:Transcriptional regulator, IclR family n=1 Tax=Alloyangia pacifica TaxID=311180 RepID=A0A1I6UW82_9RHOB|nr:IclR family transcriptional regulator [Alloyangia pacifica]SDI27990.1 transcriptional regulator, IclR family [Alloyangia pacifica]SFT05663.1 transcriptional regulator, IclR family [Alloyangia pacifica]
MAIKTLQTVSRAIAVLRAFEGGTRTMTLTELCKALELDKANVMRLTRTLVHEGLLVHDAQSRRYGISAGCLSLCRGLIGKDSLADFARPHLEHARDTTGESASLLIREGWSRVVVETAPSRQHVRFVLEPGERRPLFVGAAGQCLVSGIEDSELPDLWRVLAEEREAGRFDLTDEMVEQRSRRVREQGWTYARGEWATDVAGAAAPVRNSQGRTVGAISITVPLTRATDQLLEMCGRMAMAAAENVSADLLKARI